MTGPAAAYWQVRARIKYSSPTGSELRRRARDGNHSVQETPTRGSHHRPAGLQRDPQRLALRQLAGQDDLQGPASLPRLSLVPGCRRRSRPGLASSRTRPHHVTNKVDHTTPRRGTRKASLAADLNETAFGPLSPNYAGYLAGPVPAGRTANWLSVAPVELVFRHTDRNPHHSTRRLSLRQSGIEPVLPRVRDERLRRAFDVCRQLFHGSVGIP